MLYIKEFVTPDQKILDKTAQLEAMAKQFLEAAAAADAEEENRRQTALAAAPPPPPFTRTASSASWAWR